MSTLNVEIVSNITITETLSNGYLDATRNRVTYTGLNAKTNLDATTTPAVSKVSVFAQAMTAGAATIDLTALTGTDGQVVDGTGLKVRAVKLRNKSGNTSAITIQPGASDGYNLAGAAFKIAVEIGQSVTLELGTMAPTIGPTAKNIGITGTLAEVLECAIVMG